MSLVHFFRGKTELLKEWWQALDAPPRRECPRVQIPIFASCRSGGTSPLKNVSPVGAYILTEERWYPGSIVTMTFQYGPCCLQVAKVTDNSGATIQLRAKVVRVGQEGVGVRFVYLNGAERQKFEQFLAGA